MDFVSIRIITDATKRLVAFYEQVTGVVATWYTEDFAELKTPSCTLAIAHRRTMDLFAAGAAHPADNHSVIVEFRVSDVDAEYRRLAPVIGKVVQEPTTMPWGNRSLLFRDPDGNLVNYFTPVSPEAIKKFDRQR
ncbi:VOC family protein [Sorangium sp. So ce381]|uniref:VOC family protein n=1 Tax=Sorangium sp. So ce381 TaxID=3133307 RepID=UPI003F5C980C